MGTVTWILVGAEWIFMAFICAVIGTMKGNPISGTFLGITLGPLGVLIVLLSKDKNRVPCPYCAKKIQKAAKICFYCQKEIVGNAT
jgi:hypothetical protein